MPEQYEDAVNAVMGELYATLKSKVISEMGVRHPSPEMIADLTMKAMLSVQMHMLRETIDYHGSGVVQTLDSIQGKS